MKEACSAPEGEGEAAAALLELITGFEVTQALRASVELGVADLLVAGPMTARDMAAATGTHEAWLTRLLRYLDAFGIVSEDPSGRFGPTPRSDLLRRDHPRSLRPTAIFLSEPWFQEPYAHLAVAMQSAQAPFEAVHAAPVWQYLTAHSDRAALVSEALATLRAQRDAAVVEVCDLAGVGTVVDVAGGYGNLLAALLQSYPSMHGVLFDMPSVVSRAASTLEESGVSCRCSLVGGDMFAAVPRGGDVYVLANVIHDWGDDESVEILTNCHQSMDGRGRLILVEQVVVPGAMRRSIASADLRMMATFGDARQRTEAEFRTLLERSKFRVTRIVPTRTDFSVVEASPI
jgi:O-methyltransferase/methyltransferase family protein